MTKIIYLLGAGASAKSLPLVSEFRTFIGYFLIFLQKYHASEESIKYIQEIFEGIKYYPSPDTTARKLELGGEREKLNRLNNLIGLMFFWKENIDLSQMIDNFLDIKNTGNADKYEYLFEKLSISIDPRYIAFFSAILESPKNKILDKNLGIISWNYDSQIEKTLKMLGAPVPDKNQYIKLNGSAKVRLGKKALENAKDIINFTNQINELSSSIEYAWDDKEEILKKIGKMTQDTTKIIIIGYSFPVYNRYMDSSIFNLLGSFNHNKTLHIELVGSNESRLLEYENSVRAMLEPWDWFDANKPRELGHLQRGFMIKKSLSPGQFPIPNDLPIFGQKSISVPF